MLITNLPSASVSMSIAWVLVMFLSSQRNAGLLCKNSDLKKKIQLRTWLQICMYRTVYSTKQDCLNF